MGVASFTITTTTCISPERLFKSMILDADNLLPKVVPVPILKVELLEGDGGVGTIKEIHFTQETGLGSAKQRIEEIDEKNYIFKCQVFTGHALEGIHDYITHYVKIEPHVDGGSMSTTTVTYHTNVKDFVIPEEKIKKEEEKLKAVIKALEAYLSAHPQLYN